jgi:hypothetical protein
LSQYDKSVPHALNALFPNIDPTKFPPKKGTSFFSSFLRLNNNNNFFLLFPPLPLYLDWSEVHKRKKLFENYANAHGFDPLAAEHWYNVPREQIIKTTVCLSPYLC